jgi:uncharacterized protein YlxW (UPF0749 family)
VTERAERIMAIRARLRARFTPRATAATVVFALAGFLFALSAHTAGGTQLRSDRSDAVALLRAENTRQVARLARVTDLQAQIERATSVQAAGDAAISAQERSAAPTAASAGLTAVEGPGVVVTLDDAPRNLKPPSNAGPDDLVVHQQDVQAVVNALWAGGAEAIMLQDQRVISTSAVRCVGNTLLLQGRVYSPPYVVRAVGDVAALRRSLDASPEVSYFLQYVASLRLGWSVKEQQRIRMPAFTGPLTLRYAVPSAPLPSDTPAPSPAQTSPVQTSPASSASPSGSASPASPASPASSASPSSRKAQP